VFRENYGYSNEYQSVDIKVSLHQKIQCIKKNDNNLAQAPETHSMKIYDYEIHITSFSPWKTRVGVWKYGEPENWWGLNPLGQAKIDIHAAQYTYEIHIHEYALRSTMFDRKKTLSHKVGFNKEKLTTKRHVKQKNSLRCI